MTRQRSEVVHGWDRGTLATALVILLVVLDAVALFYVFEVMDVSHRSETGVAPGVGTSVDPGEVTEEDPESPTTPNSAPALEVGETFSAAQSDTTLLQVRKIQAPPADGGAAQGVQWMGIRPRTCMHSDARPSGRIPLSSWVAEDEQGEHYEGVQSPWADFPAQQFSTARIQPGDCQLGWVLIELPKGFYKRIEQVTFRPRAPDPGRWVL